MSQELFYTSAPVGIKPGSSGFCTVGMTAGMSSVLSQRLEMLSSYRELFPPGDPRVQLNPPAYSYLRLSIVPQSFAVLSRVCFAGTDYSQRANIFAHHVVLDASEQSPAGPAWVMSQGGVMETQWNGPPRVLPAGRPIPRGNDTPRICSAWAAATGDAGWAGVLAETASADVARVAYVIYSPGTETLPLIREAMALLSPRLRWQVTFSSYFTDLPAGVTCTWRFCVAGTPAAKDARRNATSGVVIDLTENQMPAADSPMVHAARTGEVPPEFGAMPMPAPPPFAPSHGEFTSGRGQPLRFLGADTDQPAPIGTPPPDTVLQPAVTPESNSSGPRTIFWLVAILWPLLVIPAVVTWHILSEPQENRELRQQVLQLTQKNADLTNSVEDLKNKLAPTTRALPATTGESTTKPLAEHQRPPATTRTIVDQRFTAPIPQNIPATEPSTRPRQLADSTPPSPPSVPRTPTPPAIAPSAAPSVPVTPESENEASWACADLVDGDDSKILWQETQPLLDPSLQFVAAEDTRFHAEMKQGEIKISEQNASDDVRSCWFELKNGKLSLRVDANGRLDVTSTAFRNWLKLAYIQVLDGTRIVTRVRFAAIETRTVESGNFSLELPDYLKGKDLAVRAAPGYNIPDWQFNPDGAALKCAYRQNTFTLQREDDRIRQTHSEVQTRLPSMVIDLVCKIDDSHDLTIRRITIHEH